MTETNTETVTMSESAAKRIAFLAEKEGKDLLRVSVSGGGCSGFQYNFDFDDTINDDDVLIERESARVAIDATSLDFLKGSEINFVQELIGSHFEIRNPNATANCGCGTSFSVF